MFLQKKNFFLAVLFLYFNWCICGLDFTETKGREKDSDLTEEKREIHVGIFLKSAAEKYRSLWYLYMF